MANQLNTSAYALRFDDVQIGHNGLRPNGTEFCVLGVDEEDRTVMDEMGTWYAFDDCDFPERAKAEART